MVTHADNGTHADDVNDTEEDDNARGPHIGALPLSFRSYVPFRKIRLRDLDRVDDFLGAMDPAFG